MFSPCVNAFLGDWLHQEYLQHPASCILGSSHDQWVLSPFAVRSTVPAVCPGHYTPVYTDVRFWMHLRSLPASLLTYMSLSKLKFRGLRLLCSLAPWLTVEHFIEKYIIRGNFVPHLSSLHNSYHRISIIIIMKFSAKALLGALLAPFTFTKAITVSGACIQAGLPVCHPITLTVPYVWSWYRISFCTSTKGVMCWDWCICCRSFMRSGVPTVITMTGNSTCTCCHPDYTNAMHITDNHDRLQHPLRTSSYAIHSTSCE